MNWTSPLKPAELTEKRLIEAILDGIFPVGSCLPAERELASQLKVTRPTLREALQRLGRDGWLEIHQGKPTRVKDYWHQGNLGVLSHLAHHPDHLPIDFIPNLLAVRQTLAPAYASLAVERDPASVVATLQGYSSLDESPQAFAEFDWWLHLQLTIASGNPIFTLILNGFSELYIPMACRYFQSHASRESSRRFYQALLQAAQSRDAQSAELVTRQTMAKSLELWNAAMQHQE
jgi:GntR family transcriptional regulator, negative regulator for fad regulon and positive regulator of fabA